MGKIFYIMGKSATGKDHLYEALIGREELNLHPVVLYTTRPIRKGERDGREYYFVNVLRRMRVSSGWKWRIILASELWNPMRK